MDFGLRRGWCRDVPRPYVGDPASSRVSTKRCDANDVFRLYGKLGGPTGMYVLEEVNPRLTGVSRSKAI